VEAPGVALVQQRFQKSARSRVLPVKLLMRATFEVFIDSSRFSLITPKSTEFVEALWRRRESVPVAWRRKTEFSRRSMCSRLHHTPLLNLGRFAVPRVRFDEEGAALSAVTCSFGPLRLDTKTRVIPRHRHSARPLSLSLCSTSAKR
jgi:hypothetical protein